MQCFDLHQHIPHGEPRAIALGQFDGLHLGHRAVMAAAVGAHGMIPTVFSFDDTEAVKPQEKALCSRDEFLDEMALVGIREYVTADYERLRDMSPEVFVREILCERLGAKALFCGFNYHFGKDAAGDAHLLCALCEPLGIAVTVIPPVMREGERVSSGRIRKAVSEGDMPLANRMLGHPFLIDSPVEYGNQLGRQLGSPTINQAIDPRRAVPRHGVYLSAAIVDGRMYMGVTNIGEHPTVGRTAVHAETWIAGFDGDLYGKSIPVMPLRFLRDEREFDGTDALKKQILKDRENAVGTLRGDGGTRVILFDFDDTLQHRRTAFLKYADWFIEKYFADLPDAEKEERRRDMLRLNNGGYVSYQTYFENLVEKYGLAETWETLFSDYQRVFPQYVTLFPDARETLEELIRRGYRLGIVTNGPALQQNRKLDLSGLRPLFDVVLVSAQEGTGKPEAEIFRRAALRMGVLPERCVYVGDHPENDIGGARGAGMSAVCVTYPDHMASFDYTALPPDVPRIFSLSELLRMYP